MTVLSVIVGLVLAVITYMVLTSYITSVPAILSGLISLVVFYLIARYGSRWTR